MKNQRTNAQILRWVAERSPKGYADLIRERNTEALAVLKETRESGDYYHEQLDYGCPHCREYFPCYKKDHPYPKRNCLWVRAGAIPAPWGDSFNCLTVKFGGVTADEVHGIVSLSHNRITIRLSGKETDKQYKQACTVLQKHIDWSNESYWGKKYRKDRI